MRNALPCLFAVMSCLVLVGPSVRAEEMSAAELLQAQQQNVLLIREESKNSWGRGDHQHSETYPGVAMPTGLVVYAGGLAKALSDPSRRWWGNSEAVLSRGSNDLPAMKWGRWSGNLEKITVGQGDDAATFSFQGLDMATGLIFGTPEKLPEGQASIAAEVSSPAIGGQVYVVSMLSDDFAYAPSVRTAQVIGQAMSEAAGVTVEVLDTPRLSGVAYDMSGAPLGFVSMVSGRTVLFDADDLSTIHARSVSAWQALSADTEGAGEF